MTGDARDLPGAGSSDRPPAGPAPGRPNDRATARPTDPAPTCEVCGTVMYDRHCKIVCPRCGYLRDCSDP